MPKESHRILLVEDDVDDEALTLRALAENGIVCAVSVARDGVEALDQLLGPDARAAFKPSLVLLDLKLPRLDGLAVLQRLRDDARTRFLPTVVLSSSDEPKDIILSYRYGANSYIRKPVAYEAFSRALGMVGRYWLERNRVHSPNGN